MVVCWICSFIFTKSFVRKWFFKKKMAYHLINSPIRHYFESHVQVVLGCFVFFVFVFEKANHKGSKKTELPRFQTDASRSTDSNPMLGCFAVPFLPLPLTHVLVAEDHIQNLVPRGGRARFSISCTHSRACTVVFNNNNVHLSCAHQRPERSHDTH